MGTFEGKIVIMIESKSKEKANQRLTEIAEQVISKNRDVYKTTSEKVQ